MYTFPRVVKKENKRKEKKKKKNYKHYIGFSF